MAYRFQCLIIYSCHRSLRNFPQAKFVTAGGKNSYITLMAITQLVPAKYVTVVKGGEGRLKCIFRLQTQS